MKERIFIISGATASGKSSLADHLAEHKKISIINADSLQIYKDLPILSAQPAKEEMGKVRHFLYSCLDCEESSSVVDWLKQVDLAVKESFKNNLSPVIVGGSGMYISKLINGINEIPPILSEVKDASFAIYEKQGGEGLIKEMLLLGIDESEIKHTDQQRLLRQYQIFAQTKKPISYWHQMPVKHIVDPKALTHINIEINRGDLYNRCNERFNLMFNNGAIEEVKNLVEKIGDNDSYQVTKTLGYREIRDYLGGVISKDEMINLASQKTRNYAKRQLTWFRHQFGDKKVFDSTERALEFMLE